MAQSYHIIAGLLAVAPMHEAQGVRCRKPKPKEARPRPNPNLNKAGGGRNKRPAGGGGGDGKETHSLGSRAANEKIVYYREQFLYLKAVIYSVSIILSGLSVKSASDCNAGEVRRPLQG